MTISRKKKAFLSGEANEQIPHQLCTTDVKSLRDFYYQKYGIKIIIAGESEVGRRQYEARKRQYECTQITPYLENSKKYPLTTYVKTNYHEDHVDRYGFVISLVLGGEFNAFFSDIKRAIPPEYIRNGEIIELNNAQMEILENRLNKLQCKEFILKRSADYVQAMLARKTYIGLDAKEALNEVRQIQADLGEDETVGYVYTNGTLREHSHFEVLLISKNKIIKPLDWLVSLELRIDSEEFASPTEVLGEKLGTYPQADRLACGTLGMMYLKELLKNNAQQLKKYTLSFSFVNNQEQVRQFFLPSPQVLRYSQCSFYNQVIKSMIASSCDSVTITHKGATYSIPTVEGLLKQSIEKANSLSQDQINQNKDILSHLKGFRVTWLDEYKQQEEKRNSMYSRAYGDEPGERRNVYLAYKTTKVSSSEVEKILERANDKDTILRQQEFITSLETYKEKRNSIPAEYFSFLGISKGIAKTKKIAAVEALIKVMKEGKSDGDIYTHIDAFRQGMLGNIVRSYVKKVDNNGKVRDFISSLTKENTLYRYVTKTMTIEPPEGSTGVMVKSP